jgi:hypothetical protein
MLRHVQYVPSVSVSLGLPRQSRDHPITKPRLRAYTLQQTELTLLDLYSPIIYSARIILTNRPPGLLIISYWGSKMRKDLTWHRRKNYYCGAHNCTGNFPRQSSDLTGPFRGDVSSRLHKIMEIIFGTAKVWENCSQNLQEQQCRKNGNPRKMS